MVPLFTNASFFGSSKSTPPSQGTPSIRLVVTLANHNPIPESVPHRDDHIVGNQVTRIHEPLGRFSVLRIGRHLSTEEIARRDVRQAVLPPAHSPKPETQNRSESSIFCLRLQEDTRQLVLTRQRHRRRRNHHCSHVRDVHWEMSFPLGLELPLTFFTISSHCVPFPDAGAPEIIICRGGEPGVWAVVGWRVGGGEREGLIDGPPIRATVRAGTHFCSQAMGWPSHRLQIDMSWGGQQRTMVDLEGVAVRFGKEDVLREPGTRSDRSVRTGRDLL